MQSLDAECRVGCRWLVGWSVQAVVVPLNFQGVELSVSYYWAGTKKSLWHVMILVAQAWSAMIYILAILCSMAMRLEEL